jgi:thioredoxin 1
MAVVKSNDNHLRKLGVNDKYTIVKYDNELCAYCKQLSNPYEEISNDEKFQDVLFLQMQASENPVARNEVYTKKMPFISIYRQGILVDCGCVKSENGILKFLQKLRKADYSLKKEDLFTAL